MIEKNSVPYRYPLVVIGAGAAGLVIALGYAKAGRKVLLIEKGNWGGDCTNFGCIPSKSLIASAHVAHLMSKRESYGLSGDFHSFSAKGSLSRTRRIVASVRSHEDPEALLAQGVETRTGTATFLDPHTLNIISSPEGIEEKIIADKIVIATGSYPFIPPIEGLLEVPYKTNETIFDLEEIPEHLVILGGGPIGVELAQAFRRLGAKVSLIQRPKHLLERESAPIQQRLEALLQEEGLSIYLGHTAKRVSKNGSLIQIQTDQATISASHLLVAVGRRSHIEELHLNNAGIKTHPKGILVDKYGRTSQKHIWAVGDVTGRALFTHIAENEARTVLTNLLLPFPFKVPLDLNQPIPHVTFTDPEVASVGLTEEEAIARYGAHKITTYEMELKELDRAITEGHTEGMAAIVTKKWSGKILGATIIAPRAGEMLTQVSTAMYAGLPLRKLAKIIHPYPTYSLVIRKLADGWLTKTILPKLQMLLGRKK